MRFIHFARVALLLFALHVIPAVLLADETVHIGILAKRGSEHTLNRWQPTADYLSREIPGYRFTVVPLEFDEVEKSVASKEVEFVLVNSAIYVELEMRYGVGRIATLITRNGAKGSSRFGGVIFTRADRTDIRQIRDLDGKRFDAVDKNSLGGFLAAWREMEKAGLSPYKETILNFLGTHDNVVYDVLDGRADAGTVRTDILERMQSEGKIDILKLKIIDPQLHKGFAYLCSTRLYPEWPIAKLRLTSESLSNAVAAALLRMQADSPEAEAAEISGWTVPRNYQPVHELLRELHVGPYAGYGRITFEDLLLYYWHWLLMLIAALVLLISAVFYVIRLNQRLRETERELTGARDNLVQKVHERTKELEESQRHLEHISKEWNDAFDAISDPIFIHDRDMNIVQANPAYCMRAGHTLEEMAGRPYYEFFPRLDAPLASCLEFPKQLEPEGDELQLPGGEIFVSRSFSIVRADSSAGYAIHVLEDVTEARRGEARRRTMSRALEQAGDGVMIFDAQRRVLYCNPALQQLLNSNGEEGCDRPDLMTDDIVSRHFTGELLQLFEEAEKGKSASGEMALSSDAAGKRPVFITVSCIRSEEGEREGYVLTVLDISEVRHAEEALIYRIDLESMIAGIASRLVNVEAEAIDREINDALQQLGEFAATDRVYLFHYEPQSGSVSNTYEWCAPNIEPQIERLQGLPLAQFPWLRGELLANREVSVPDVAALPESASKERDAFLHQGVLSLLMVPLNSGGTFSGFIGFDNVREPRKWEAADIHLLRLAGEIIFNSLERVGTIVRLQRSEASLTVAQHIAQMGNWEWNIVTDELLWSDEIYRIFGLTPEEFGASYDAFLKALHPGDREYVISEVNKAVAGEKEYAIDHRILRPDGSEAIVHEIGRVDFDETGAALRMIGTVQDVTQLRNAEHEMQRLNRALRTLSRCNTTLVHAHDEQVLMDDICRILIDSGGYRFAWVGYAESDEGKTVRPVAFAGYEQGYIETVNVSWSDDERGSNPAGYAIRNRAPFVARDIAGAADAFGPWREAALKQGYVSVIALPLISKDELFGAIVIDSSEYDAFDEHELMLLVEMAGDLAFGIRTLRSRDKHLRAEQALRETEARYEELYEKAPNGYVSVSAEDGSLLQFNQSLCDMLGYERTAMKGKKVFDLYADSADGVLRAKAFFKRLGEGESIRNAELKMRHADGHTVWVSVSVEPVKDAQGKVRESRSSITDITARKQAEAEQQRFAEQLQTSLIQTIRAIALTIEKRDPYTAGHQERVAELAMKIGECMGLDEKRLEGLHLGALIHDIGKISVPAEILNRPGTLETALFAIIKSHPSVGYDIIKGIDFPWPLAEMVLHHHERMDGSGYPDGLKGDEISLESRILIVADVVEAMASHRPYRPALGMDMALAEIEQGKGTLYDPDVVECCIGLFREKETPWA